MTRTAVLDNVVHKDLRVRTGHSAEFGDNVNQAMVFPTEFAFVQREYPILFRKDGNGDFQSVALLGLDADENLFLDESGWNARYVPAMQQRGPFIIGLRKSAEGESREPLVQVDLDHPRISKTEGEMLFLPHGGNSRYLDHASRILQIIYSGTAHIRPMFAAFEATGLIEPVAVDVEIDRTLKYKLPGFFTISADRLAALGGGDLERLNKAGYLQLAMQVLASLGNVSWLIELKNRKRAADKA